MTSPAPLLARGRSVTFTDGTVAQLRYSLGALALLEQRHGGIDNVLLTFEKLDGEGGLSGVIIGPMLELIGAGLTGSGGSCPTSPSGYPPSALSTLTGGRPARTSARSPLFGTSARPTAANWVTFSTFATSTSSSRP